MSNFTHSVKVELFDTDACGIIFYSQLFQLAHRAFSAFLESRGVSIQERIKKQDYFFPVVHAEADYLAPIYTDDILKIEVKVEKLGNSSLTMSYAFHKDDEVVAKALVVHVSIDKNKQKIGLPRSFCEALRL